MTRIGIADIGSNTARLIVFSYEAEKWFTITDGIREPIRLGSGLAEHKRLTDDAMARAQAALELFCDYARATELDQLEIFGTSAIRDADNGNELLQRAELLDTPMQVISGEDEAALGVLAVANGFDFEDAWTIDLGGGSAQISRMADRRYQSGQAYPLGTVRLTEEFLASDPPTRREVKALEEKIDRELGPGSKKLAGKPPIPLVGIGGTVRNLARMAQKKNRYPLASLHGYELTRDALEEITSELLRTRLEERREIAGLNPDRADIVNAGALVFRWLLRRSGADGLTISGHGVREGAFYRHFLPAPHLIDDVRRFSVLNRARRHPLPPGHVEHVRFLAGRLFEELSPLHDLAAPERELLDAAAVLHDIGTTLDYYRHHKHGSYLLNVAPLNGFSHRELALLTLLIRYHRRGLPRLGSYRKLAGKGDRKRLIQLATCLRLAESLERARSGRILDLGLNLNGSAATIWLATREEPTVELWEARKHAELFEMAFGKKLDLSARAEF